MRSIEGWMIYDKLMWILRKLDIVDSTYYAKYIMEEGLEWVIN